MNYIYQLNTTFCPCGTELYREDLCLPFGGELGTQDEDATCRACCDRIEAEVMAERALDFQYLSAEWFTRDLRDKAVAQLTDEKWAAERMVEMTRRVVAVVVADSMRRRAVAGERFARAS